ncbi:proteasome alpha subunit [Nitzschia inconspicua]|uniref:Proteasome subunit alpha type n=1 Tax=Nitzschia inconspicua TaxID=303405 RepID=A0A9K3LV20_9STRA|nr:proteasome alpha subunit [Nitzschia inconspicua]
MFRNQYDTDVTVWSPEGRLLQVEYAMESVKQGSACVGVRSNTHVVLGALKRSVSELSSHQKKLLEIDDHIGIGIAGLTADARSLAKYMRNECLNHKYVFGAPITPALLMGDLADKHQRTTQTYVRRPFGVGLLVAGIDPQFQTAHLYQTCPSGNMYEFYASAIGARSQSARTYLEKHYESFTEASLDDLIIHALQALVGCVSGDDELTKENGSIAFLGKDQKFTMLEGDALQPYLDRLELKNAEEEKDDDDDEEEKEGDAPQAMET